MARSPVALVRPRWPYPVGRREPTYNRIWMPLSLATTAALLREAGFQVRVVDAHAERMPAQAVAAAVRGCDTAFVTSSSFDRWQCPNIDIDPFVDVCRLLRRQCRALYVTGFHGTAEPETVLRRTGADGVILGEPEFVIRDICAGVATESVYRDIDGTRPPARCARSDVRALPAPALDGLPLAKYVYELLPGRFALMETARGCPHACRFCTHVLLGQGVRRKTPAQVEREAAVLRSAGVETVYVMDLEFAADRDFAMAVCDVLASQGLAWCCQTRLANLDDALIARMAKSGCRLVHTGIESASEPILRRAGKPLDAAGSAARLRALEAAGIDTLGFFILGFPGETRAQMVETVRLACRLDPTYASFHPYTPYHGSRMGGVGRRGRLWAVPSVAGKAMAKKAFLRFYLSPRRLARRVRNLDLRRLKATGRLLLSYLAS